MTKKVLNYIIRFLLGDDLSQNLATTIGYTSDRKLFHRYNIVILPSGFFDTQTYGTQASLPALPLPEIEGIPLLFGTPTVRKEGATLVVHADIIASTYFLISRYEEMLRRTERDAHGRFPGKQSLPYRAGFIHRPVVDEYRLLLRRWLRETNLDVPPVPIGIRRAYLTHDVDAPFLYRSWKGFIRCLRDTKSLRKALRAKFGPLEEDPYYTFPHIFREDKRLLHASGQKRAQACYFIKAGGNTPQDKPRYSLANKDIRPLLRAVAETKGVIGLHSSYHAGKEPARIQSEKEKLEKATGQRITYNRHHFLALRQPEDLEAVEAAKIGHDFTMGYADMAGFRLGTCYPVRAINPTTRRLSPVTLHPLLIMDCTLNDPKYMALNEEEATALSLKLLEKVRQVGGECTLLWHNTSFANSAGNYLKPLYSLLINELIRK